MDPEKIELRSLLVFILFILLPVSAVSQDTLRFSGQFSSWVNAGTGGELPLHGGARAMVKKPSLVLADEPTANLDAANSHNILKTMETLNRKLSTTFLFATHDEKVISYLHRKIYLVDGRVDKDEKIR